MSEPVLEWTDNQGHRYNIILPDWYDLRNESDGRDRAGFRLEARPASGVGLPMVSVDLYMSGDDLQHLRLEGNTSAAVRRRKELRECFTEGCRRAIYNRAISGMVELQLSPKPCNLLGLYYDVIADGEPQFLLTDSPPVPPEAP